MSWKIYFWIQMLMFLEAIYSQYYQPDQLPFISFWIDTFFEFMALVFIYQIAYHKNIRLKFSRILSVLFIIYFVIHFFINFYLMSGEVFTVLLFFIFYLIKFPGFYAVYTRGLKGPKLDKSD